MQTAFPPSDYYEGSAPLRGRQPTVGLPPTTLVAWVVGQPRSGSHVHCVSIGGGGTQLSPGSIATITPQTFTVASDTG